MRRWARVSVLEDGRGCPRGMRAEFGEAGQECARYEEVLGGVSAVNAGGGIHARMPQGMALQADVATAVVGVHIQVRRVQEQHALADQPYGDQQHLQGKSGFACDSH